MKAEFTSLVKSIFENPELLKTYVASKTISIGQAKEILRTINTYNSKDCACCRRFDRNKLKISPVENILEPILDIAQINVSKKRY